MRRKHHRRHQGRFTRLASLAPSLTASAAVRLLLAAALVLGLTVADAAAQNPTVTLSLSPTSLAEGDGATDVIVTATLSAARPAATTMTLTLGGTARATDYTLSGSVPSITIPANSLSADAVLRLSPVDDDFFEGDETIQVGGTATGLTVTGTSVTLRDDERKPELVLHLDLQLEPGLDAIHEGGPAAGITVRLTLSGATFEDDVAFTLVRDSVDSTATPDDYRMSPSLPYGFTFPAGRYSTSFTMTFQALDDSSVPGGLEEWYIESLYLRAEAPPPLDVRSLPGSQSSPTHITFYNTRDTKFVHASLATRTRHARAGSSTEVGVTVSTTSGPRLRQVVTVTITPTSFQKWFEPEQITLTANPGEPPNRSARFTVTPVASQVTENHTIGFATSFSPTNLDRAIFRPIPASHVLRVYKSSTAPKLVEVLVEDFDLGNRGVLGILDSGFPPDFAGDSLTFKFDFDRPLTLTGSASVTFDLDSGRKSAPCRSTTQPNRIYCRYSIDPGDYDYDRMVEIPAGGLNFAWSDTDDPTITWPVPTVPSNRTSWPIPMPIYGGAYGVDLAVSLQSIQEGTGARPLTVTAVAANGIPAPVDLEVPLSFRDVTTTAADYLVSGALSISIPAGQTETRTMLTVTPVADGVPEARIETVRIESAPESVVWARGADLAIIDDAATPELVLSPSSLTMAEGGQATYTVALATQPSAPVTVSIRGQAGTDLTLDQTRLTFTSSNWNAAQTVTVTARQDGDASTDTATLVHTASGGGYDSVTADLAVAIIDDEATTGIVLSPSSLTVAEGGQAAYTVALATQPSTPVTVSIRGQAGTDLTLDQTSLTFTVSDWLFPQTVTVTAGQDNDGATDTATLVHTATGGGGYAAVTADLAVTVTDDEATAGIVLTPPSLTVAEGGQATYTVVLATEPSAPVTVSITGQAGTDLTLDKTSLTFSSSNWLFPQTVTVTAGQDGDASTDRATLAHTASGGGYDSVTADLAVGVTDDEAPVEIVLSPSTLTVAEGGEATYTVALATEPSAPVTVAISGGRQTLGISGGLTLDQTSLTFTVSDWLFPQTVIMTAEEDDDGVGDTATFVHTASGGGYDSVTADLAVTVTDNDTPGIVLSPPTLTVAEGGQATYTVMLATWPLSSLTVAISGTSGTDLTLDKTSLTFSSSNWLFPQTVTVTAGEDDDGWDDTATLVHTATPDFAEGAEYDSVTADLAATVADNDTPGLVLSPPSLTVAEGGEAIYTVALATEPSAPVTVAISGTSGTDLTLDQTSLTFTASTWSTAQTVTVTAGEDSDAEPDDPVTLTHTVSGGDYGAVAADEVVVTIGDDDTASTEIELTLDPQQVTEGGGAQTVRVTAMLNAATRIADTVVRVTIAGNTATEVEDFGAVSSFNVTIPATAASATGTFSLTPVNDGIAEGEETLTVSGTATGLTVDPATLILGDDDIASTGIALSLDPQQVTEDGGAQTVRVTAMLNAATHTADTVVNVSVAGLTATVVEDFAAVGGFQITIPATQTNGQNSFSLTPVNDTVAEGEETLQVRGTSALPVTPATLTLADDDIASTGIALTLDLQQVTEDGGAQTVRVTAMLNAGAHTADTVVNVTVAGLTATEVEDFAAVGGFPITIPATAASATGTFSLTPVNDGIAEGDETLQVRGISALPVTPATLTLADDDIVSTGIALTLDPEQVTEDGGAQTVRVTAMLNAGARTQNTVVQVTVAGLTATVVEDFAAVGGFPITIPATAASATGTFSLTPVNDGIAEGEETLQVRGTSPLLVTPATLTLADDDIASTGIALTLNPEQVTEDGGAQTVRVTAMLNADTHTANTVVNVSVAGLTATVVEDFAAVGDFQITIPATQTNGQNSFSLTPVNDAVAEGDETLTVSGASPLPVTPATLTLADDDIASTGIELSLDPQQVTEDGGAQTVRVTAMLNAATHTANTVVNVSVAGLTATVVEDFAAVGGFQIIIPATQTNGQNSFSLTPVNDGIAEGEETLTVSGTATGLTVDPATLILGDDDIASTGIALSLDPQQVTEDGGAQTVRVTAMLNAATHTADTVVNVSVAGLTATVVEDFAAVGGFQITIPATQTNGQNSFSLTPVNDTVAEGEETLQVRGTSALPVTPATLTLADDDIASTGIALTLDLQQVTEDGGAQTVRVTAMLNAGAHTADTVVNVTVAGLTATEVEDFAAVGGFPITIPATAASATGTFSLTPVNDGIAEGDETLQVRGISALPVTPATLTLADDDIVSTGIALTLDPEQVTEDGGAQTVRVTAMLNAGARTQNTVVQVTVAGLTATVVEDFAAVGGFPITIPATAASATGTFSLTPVNDGIAEGEETLQVRGTSPLPVTPATLTLADDDIASTGIALTLNPEQVTEDGGAQTVRVTAMLNAGARTQNTVVQVTVAGLTATVVEDFAAVGGFPITIPANQASATGTFSLTPVNDGIAEGEETLQVRGTSPLLVTPATLTLADDDIVSTGIALTLNPEQVTEDGGAQTVRVTAMLNAGARTQNTVVQVTVAGLTATVVEDFAAVGGFPITIPANQASATGTFSLTPVNDGIAEGEETLQVRGTSPLLVTPATLTLADDDIVSTGIALSLDPQQVTEDGGAQTVRVTAMLNAGARTQNTVVQVTVAGLTATVVEDFAAVGGFPITIPANQASATGTFSLTPVNDGIAEGEETLQVRGTSPLLVTPATLTLADDDIVSTGIALSLDPQQVTEDGGAQTVRVTAMLNADTHTANTVVNVSVAGLTATVVEDFAAVGDFQITIPATQTNGQNSFSLTPVNDAVAEGDETLTVSGASPLPVTPATLTLADDDIASTGIELSLDPQQVTEDGGAQTVRVTAMLNADTRTADTVVNVSVAGDTATEVDDFAAVSSFNVTIPATAAGATGTFTLTPVNDIVAEGGETLQVSGTATGLTVDPATLILGDDDTASTGIALSLNPERVTEQGGRQTVTVTAVLNTGARTADTLVNVSVAGLTATVVEDFAAVGGFQITIPATQTNGQNSFSLTPVNDTFAEGEETLTVSGASPLPVTAAELTISDDDIASTGIALTLNPQQVTEQGGRQTVRVTAMLNAGARTQNTVVNVSVAAGTAESGDFVAVQPFQITIPAGAGSGETDFSVTPVNDAIAEGDETLQVSGTSALPVTAVELTISDDDIASNGIALTLDPQQITEQGGRQTVRVTAMLNAGTRTQNTVVRVTVAGLTATVVEDFAAVSSFNVTIPANQPSGEADFSLTPVNDAVAEGEETLTVSAASPLPVTPATLTLADDDIVSTGIALTLNPEQITEQGGQQTVRVTAMLNAGARTQNTVVQVTVAGDTATVVEDFAAVGGFPITIPATAASATGTFSLTPVNDAIAEGDETLQVSGIATDLTVDPATLILGDDDIASNGIALTLDPEQVTEQGGRQTVTVTAMLNAGTRTQNTVVRVTVAGLTATAVEDFAAVSSFHVTIPTNQASGQNTFSLTPVNDAIAEGDETLQVSGTSALSVTAAELTLADDDIASTGIELMLDPQRVTEQGGRQTVTVTAMLNAGARTQNTVVQVTVAGDTATVMDDFAAVGGFPITIPATAASATGTFSLTPVNDAIAEGDETLQVSGIATGLTVDPATLILGDDDIASNGIALTLDPQQITEQGGRQTVTVTAMLNAGTRTQNTVVRVTVAGLTATVVEDFAAVSSFNVTIPANQPSGEADFSLTPVNDAVAEGEETLTVSAASPLPVTPATLTLADDDIVSTGIALSLDPQQVSEDDGAQTVRVTAMLNAGTRTQNTVVRVTVAGLTATVVEDFAAVGGFPITIPATAASATGTFSLTPVNDGIAEGDETLHVSGTSALSVTAAELTISDDDTASSSIALSLDPDEVTEQGGRQTVTVTAVLNAGARTADTLVNVSVAGLTATVVEDFAAVGGFQITIPATQTNGQNSFSLTPVNDGIAEGDETLQVSGTSTLSVTAAELTISDDDIVSTGIALSLDPQRVSEQGGRQTVRVTAMLNAGTRTQNTVVRVTVAGNTATVVEDFEAVPSFHVTIPANQASATGTFSLTPVNDAIAEGDETLQVSGIATGLTVDPATLILGDDDIASNGIALTLDPEQVTEQGGRQTVRVTAMLNAGTRTADTVVNVSVAAGTAEAEDFVAVQPFQITIPANQPSGEADFSLTPVNDGIAEGGETLQVSGASPLPVTAATLTISDDDTASSSIALSLDPDEVTEQGGRQTVTVTAVLNAGARTADTLVNVSVAGLTATVVEDFAAVGGFPITIPATAASATGTFSLTPVNDGIAEGGETLQVRGAATGLTVTAATLTISDDDTASSSIALSLDPDEVTEQGGRQTVTVTAVLNAGARTADTVVNVSVAGLTATVVEDFAAVGGFQITIPATQTNGQNSFSLTPVNDGIAEGDETLQVSGTSTLSVTAAELTISDDDIVSTGIALSLDPQRVSEQGGRQTVTVTAMLNAGTRTQNTVVQVTVAGNTATVVDDFAAVPSFNVTIPATEASATGTFSLTPVNDAITEGDETLQVSGIATGLTVDGATLTLGDDDTASTRIELMLDPTRVTEDGGAQTVTVTAMLNAGARTAATVVNVTVAGNTATVGDDFAAVPSFHVTIPANQLIATGPFLLTPVNDGTTEGDETLQVNGAATGLTVDGATLTIIDSASSDPPPPPGGGGGGFPPPPPPTGNNPPTADAGPDQIGVWEGALVTLDGSGSSDPDDDPLRYRWNQSSGESVVLSSRDVANPTFTAPQGLTADAVLSFRLLVTDPGGRFDSDTVTVTVEQGTSLPPVTEEQIYYFPHLAVGEGWQTTITYINYSPQVVNCRTEFLSDQGTPLLVSFAERGTVVSWSDVLPPGGSVHEETNVELSSPLARGWARAACSGPVKASLLYRRHNSAGMPTAEAGVNAAAVAATRFVTFAEQEEGQFGTGVAYANPSPTSATVTFTAKDVDGETLARVDKTLSPGGHDAQNMVDLFDLSSFTGSLEVTSTEPIVSLSLNFEADPVFSSLPPGELHAAAPGSTTYYFPHLAVGASWQTTITYINYSPQEVSCQTEFLSDHGSPLLVSFAGLGTVISRSDTLPPGGSVHEETNVELSAPLARGWARATCSGPVKASLLYRRFEGGLPTGEAGVNATTVPATRFITFAEQGEGQHGTGVAYANPSDTAALVTFTARDAAGQTLTSVDQTLLPNGHDAQNMVDLFDLTSFTGSLEITSTEPIVSLSLNFEADPVFSSLPPGEVGAAAQGATLSSQTAMPTTATTPYR